MSSSESSAVGGVQGCLLKLHSFLGDTETRNAALICHDIIGDLGQECMVTKSENELGKKLQNVACGTCVSHLSSVVKLGVSLFVLLYVCSDFLGSYFVHDPN